VIKTTHAVSLAQGRQADKKSAPECVTSQRRGRFVRNQQLGLQAIAMAINHTLVSIPPDIWCGKADSRFSDRGYRPVQTAQSPVSWTFAAAHAKMDPHGPRGFAQPTVKHGFSDDMVPERSSPRSIARQSCRRAWRPSSAGLVPSKVSSSAGDGSRPGQQPHHAGILTRFLTRTPLSPTIARISLSFTSWSTRPPPGNLPRAVGEINA